MRWAHADGGGGGVPSSSFRRRRHATRRISPSTTAITTATRINGRTSKIGDGPGPDGTIVHVAGRVFGASIVRVIACDVSLEAPVHPVNRYTVPFTVTVSGTDALAVPPSVYQPAPCAVPTAVTIRRRCSVLQVAFTVFGASIEIVAFAAGFVEFPDHPANAYRVPVPAGTVVATPNVAVTVASYQPDPVGEPWTDETVRRNCNRNVASYTVGVAGVTAWPAAPLSLHPENA